MQVETPQDGPKKGKNNVLVFVLILIIVGLCAYIALGKTQKQQEGTANSVQSASQAPVMEADQGEYVKPETPIDRSKNVTLPGWGGFTIPANTTSISEGFEFHNPADNRWYEDQISIDGKQLENLIVDSGNKVELDHYLKLAGIDDTASEVTDYDSTCFQIETSENGALTIEGIAGFEGSKTITIKTPSGSEQKLDITCAEECYYMTFGLYLEDQDELLYQSDLVSPGKYIQKMEMTRSLEPGTYDAYVVCQPYRSDKITETNQGVVKITLTAK